MSKLTKSSDKDLRVISRKMIYTIGIPLNLSIKQLSSDQYFGQYGHITKVVIMPGNNHQNTTSAYITFQKEIQAAMAIVATHGSQLDGNYLNTIFGTVKYCYFFLKKIACKNPDCPFYHVIDKKNQTYIKDSVVEVFEEHKKKARDILISNEISTVKWKNIQGVLPSPELIVKQMCPQKQIHSQNDDLNEKIVKMLLRECEKSVTSKYLKNRTIRQCKTTRGKIQQALHLSFRK